MSAASPPRAVDDRSTRRASRVSPPFTPVPPFRSRPQKPSACSRGLYGSSEVQALFSIADGENRLRGGGVPVSEQALLAVRDPDTGAALPHGASGELWIDAPSRFVEYLDDPSATARAIDAEGVFQTGDLAHLADLGFIFEARTVTRCGLVFLGQPRGNRGRYSSAARRGRCTGRVRLL